MTYEGQKLKKTSTKYTMVYPYDNIIDTDDESDLNVASNANYEKNTKIYGDAIRETSSGGNGSSSWEGNDSNFMALSSPFILRGGYLDLSSRAGRFYFRYSGGGSDFRHSFHPVVVPIT